MTIDVSKKSNFHINVVKMMEDFAGRKEIPKNQPD
jgi:hypothetical protein